ncbi:pseudouridine synthase [Vreelandella boliviensis]|uniref:Pseudouridine synthase n=1 Tax=Vreelandella boliviensis LC1 TaxID=1072583 RepID=A0A265DXM3_9GAMM|nr:pseudouridine synthase [Halomonas boliviensis]EHJ93136.1 Ribosomal large subunit pseudouridine synthase E [Halomonas boliviensis LC1]OZT73748.1 pseudouridine synthase [Halomonas boliviensis LC1]
MSTLYLLHKPYRMLSQFTDKQGRATLADVITVPDVYAAGRLDYDSEGLLLLSDDGELIHRISHPRHKQPKTYWVQVEGDISEAALKSLRQGITLKDGPTQPAKARQIAPPASAPRQPPIDPKRHPSTSWLELTISEGRNRQVRRMTAHVGFPTLRLIRTAIGPWQLDGLAPGEWRTETLHAPRPTDKHPNRRKAPRKDQRARPAAKHRKP